MLLRWRMPSMSYLALRGPRPLINCSWACMCSWSTSKFKSRPISLTVYTFTSSRASASLTWLVSFWNGWRLRSRAEFSVKIGLQRLSTSHSGSYSNRHREIAYRRTYGVSLRSTWLLCDMEKSFGTSGLPKMTEASRIAVLDSSTRRSLSVRVSRELAAITIKSTS